MFGGVIPDSWCNHGNKPQELGYNHSNYRYRHTGLQLELHPPSGACIHAYRVYIYIIYIYVYRFH